MRQFLRDLLTNQCGIIKLQRSDGGGVFEILDRMNGPVLCGCETLAACQVIAYLVVITLWI